uniref:TSA: Wollemia nobilis Ref_Wollemi_Transcript_5011_1123 transcribed RNA sequence n=1 Tax=Wollemia nobilis TaxID=56998 RepID=A0A0C9RPN9_9CONI
MTSLVGLTFRTVASSKMSGNPLLTVSSAVDYGRKPLVHRAVIVGGGLGGLSAAIQLRKIGIDAHVYDKYQRLSGGEGTMISIFPNGCKVLYHADPVILDKEKETAVVHFRKGDETISVNAPLVIGADGIHSITRNILFGAIPPRDNGRTMWRAVIDRSLCTHEALVIGTLASMQNGRTTFIINGVRDKLYWAFSVTDESTEGGTRIRSRDKEEAKERLLKYFEGWDVATHIIQVTDPELILERRVLDVPVLPKWSSGRVVLLGDAVHAVTPSYGQGANLAFEDGLELAKQLATSYDLRNAFEAYERARIPRASIISQKSQSLGTRPTDEFYNWLYTDVPEV